MVKFETFWKIPVHGLKKFQNYFYDYITKISPLKFLVSITVLAGPNESKF